MKLNHILQKQDTTEIKGEIKTMEREDRIILFRSELVHQIGILLERHNLSGVVVDKFDIFKVVKLEIDKMNCSQAKEYEKNQKAIL